MIPLLQYPEMDCATQLTRKMIDRLNRQAIAGTLPKHVPLPEYPRAALPKFVPPIEFKPRPFSHRETFALFGECLDGAK